MFENSNIYKLDYLNSITLCTLFSS